MAAVVRLLGVRAIMQEKDMMGGAGMVREGTAVIKEVTAERILQVATVERLQAVTAERLQAVTVERRQVVTAEGILEVVGTVVGTAGDPTATRSPFTLSSRRSRQVVDICHTIMGSSTWCRVDMISKNTLFSLGMKRPSSSYLPVCLFFCDKYDFKSSLDLIAPRPRSRINWRRPGGQRHCLKIAGRLHKAEYRAKI